MSSRLLLGLCLSLGFSFTALAAEPPDRQTVGDLTVFVALVPSRMIDDDQYRKEVQGMHGGVPAWGNSYHVIASVFDAKTRQRLNDMDIRASVSRRDSKLTGGQKQLAPMLIESQRVWGNFFNVPASDPFRIRLDIRRQSKGAITTVEFAYKQRPHFEPQSK